MAKVSRLDHYGRGIVQENGKIVFVSNALVGEDIEYKIIKSAKTYNEAQLVNILCKSKNRVAPKCPYFGICGGCALEHMPYEDSLKFKKQKVTNILQKYANLKIEIRTIKNDNPYNYRNKISLKIKNGKIGFYASNSHDLIEIDECKLAQNIINKLIKDYRYFNIINGNVTIRANYQDELLIIINSSDNINIDTNYLINNYKIKGIVVNDQLFYKDDKFIEKIDNYLFQVSYNSFFQVNRIITLNIFNLIKKYIKKDTVVVDMFCGVGTLSIVAATKALKVYGIEIVKNAVGNALINKEINNCENVGFLLGDANKLVFMIKDKIDTLIIDPPRRGISKQGLNSILKILPNMIIYISCDPMTLARDLSKLKSSYMINDFYVADMFSYTYHVECICVLKLK